MSKISSASLAFLWGVVLGVTASLFLAFAAFAGFPGRRLGTEVTLGFGLPLATLIAVYLLGGVVIGGLGVVVVRRARRRWQAVLLGCAIHLPLFVGALALAIPDATAAGFAFGSFAALVFGVAWSCLTWRPPHNAQR